MPITPNTGSLFHAETHQSEIQRRYGDVPAVKLAIFEKQLTQNTEIDENTTLELTKLVSPEALVEARLTALVQRGEFREGKELASQSTYADNDISFYRWRSLRFRAYCLARLDDEQLMPLISTFCASEPQIAHSMPLSTVARWLDKPTRRRLAASIAVPIILDLYSKNQNNDLDNVRSYAYEDFLLAHGFERPSQLSDKIGNFDRAELIYYLRFLCIPSVMQVSAVYSGTKDLQDERLAVASLLVKLDPENADLYEKEIREIARAQLIQRGVRHVEQSKIFIDTVALKRWAEKNLKENFDRFQGLPKEEMSDDAFVAAVRDFVSAKSPLPTQFLELPKNEATDILIGLVRSFFRECLYNPEHGLDCYLSMRIRHGTLSGQLRAPLEVENVITQRDDSRSDSYKPNQFWLDRLASVDGSARSEIDKQMQSLSREYDGLIDSIANDLIRVKSKERPKGLFDLRVTAIGLRLLASRITQSNSFEGFLDLCFEMFWDAVNESLTTVRNTIDAEIKPSANEIFSRLQISVTQIGRDYPVTAELTRAIGTAQTGAQQAFDRVKDWFRLSQAIDPPQFTFEEMLDVGLQCVQTIHPNFKPQIAEHVIPLPPFADSLTLFSDIFFIAFDNVRRHAGVADKPKIRVDVGSEEGDLKIRIENEISGAAFTPEAVSKIEKIKETIANGAFLNIVSSEGGTGLIKIRKILGGSEKQSPYDFGFDKGNFFIEFSLKTREISL
jgi:hypothetical protein